MTGWQVAVAALVGMPGIVLGTLVVVRGPRIVGGLLITLGLLPVAVLTPDAVVAGGTAPQGLDLVPAVMSAAGWVWLYLPPALLAAYVPDGRLGRRWWALPVGWGVFLVVFHTAVALDPETYGSGPGQIRGIPPSRRRRGWEHSWVSDRSPCCWPCSSARLHAWSCGSAEATRWSGGS